MTVPITKTRLFSAPAWRKPTVLMALLLLTVSCAAHSKPSAHGPDSVKALLQNDSYKTEKTLRDEYRRWKGTKHKMGGTDDKGVDCSGFVQAVYGSVFDINLPRTTKDQLKWGIPVSRSALQAGDLVFFTPPDYPRHVGIYLDNNQFIHASKTQGVTISHIDPYYWGKYYWTARRFHRNH